MNAHTFDFIILLIYNIWIFSANRIKHFNILTSINHDTKYLIFYFKCQKTEAVLRLSYYKACIILHYSTWCRDINWIRTSCSTATSPRTTLLIYIQAMRSLAPFIPIFIMVIRNNHLNITLIQGLCNKTTSLLSHIKSKTVRSTQNIFE